MLQSGGLERFGASGRYFEHFPVTAAAVECCNLVARSVLVVVAVVAVVRKAPREDSNPRATSAVPYVLSLVVATTRPRAAVAG